MGLSALRPTSSLPILPLEFKHQLSQVESRRVTTAPPPHPPHPHPFFQILLLPDLSLSHLPDLPLPKGTLRPAQNLSGYRAIHRGWVEEVATETGSLSAAAAGGPARLPIGSAGAQRPPCAHAQRRRGEVTAEPGLGGSGPGFLGPGSTGGSGRGSVPSGTRRGGRRPLCSAEPSPPRRRSARRHCCPGPLGPLRCASAGLATG